MGKHTTGGACRAQHAGERAERARATIIHYSPMAGARSQNADWTRPGPPPPAGPCARRPPRRSLARTRRPLAGAWAARQAPGARRRGATRGCTFPSCLRLLANRAFACLFSRLKGTIQSWKTGLTSRQKREKGWGTKLSVDLNRLRGADRERKYLGNLCKSTASPRSYVIFQNGGLPALIWGHPRNSHNFFKLQN